MSTTTDTTIDSAHGHDDGHAEHPSDVSYMRIALWLAILTAVEVALYYFPPGAAEVPLLLGLMVVKFAIVASEFMHLRFDKRPLLTWVFVLGVAMAMAVYVAMMTAFEYWA